MIFFFFFLFIVINIEFLLFLHLLIHLAQKLKNLSLWMRDTEHTISQNNNLRDTEHLTKHFIFVKVSSY